VSAAFRRPKNNLCKAATLGGAVVVPGTGAKNFLVQQIFS